MSENEAVNYVISRDGHNITINDTLIDEAIFDWEFVNYRYIDRAEQIVDLQRWLAEARQANREYDALLMDQDADYLKTLKDDYVFSNISTNEFIAFSDNKARFMEICKEILDAHIALTNEKNPSPSSTATPSM